MGAGLVPLGYQVDQIDDGRIGGAGVVDDFSSAEEVDAIANLEHLRIVVGDQDDRNIAPLLQFEHQIQDETAFAHTERGQRLVHDQDGRVRVDGTGDGNALALTAREHRDRVVDIGNADTEIIQVFDGQRAHQLVVEKRNTQDPFLSFPAQEHVVVNAEIVDQRQILIHGLNTQSSGFDRRIQVDWLPVECIGSAIRLVKAAQNLDQRRLAGAIVSHQPEHLAPVQSQADIGERGDCTETFAQVLGLENDR